MQDLYAEFVVAYNFELEGIGCKARVAISGADMQNDSMTVHDMTRGELGILPMSTGVKELAAMIQIAERAYQRGLHDGKCAENLGRTT